MTYRNCRVISYANIHLRSNISDESLYLGRNVLHIIICPIVMEPEYHFDALN